MKILPVLGRQEGVQKFWQELQTLGVKEEYNKPERILVLGGDGTLLGAQRKYYKMNIPIIGVGFGRVNFLLNRNIQSPIELYEKLLKNDWMQFAIGGMEAQIRTNKGIEENIAFNDIYIKAMDPTGVVQLKLNTQEFSNVEVVGDGLIVATPQGSTAYTRNAGGTILPLGSMLWCLTGICTQKKMRVTVVQQEIKIDVLRGDAVLVTDNKKFEQVQSVIITSSKHEAIICLDRDENFEQRRYNE